MREFRNPDAALDPRRIDAIVDATTPHASGRPHMTASTGPDRTTATTDKLASTSSPTSPSRSGDLALQRPGGAMRSWTYLTLASSWVSVRFRNLELPLMEPDGSLPFVAREWE
jgi:hypothetical protein